MTAPTLTPITSSMFDGQHYDPTSRVLTLRFTNGAIHRYDDVPAEKHAAFVESASPGRYFNERIKGVHIGRKL